MSSHRAGLGLVALVTLVTACDEPGPRRAEAAAGAPPAIRRDSAFDRARQDSILRSSPGYIVDSILPVEEELRRFHAEVGDRPSELSDGAHTRSALIEAFVSAVERNDTSALAQLVVTRREFGHLVYPSSPNARPPYRQSPQLVWLQRSAATNKGAARLLSRLGGRPLGFVGYTCPSPPTKQGENTVWLTCLVKRVVPGGATASIRLFGPIIERGGRFKFLSLSNAL